MKSKHHFWVSQGEVNIDAFPWAKVGFLSQICGNTGNQELFPL